MEEQGLDRGAAPSLDEVIAVREQQASELAAWLDAVTPEQLDEPAPIPDDERWPPYARGRSVRQCLGTVLNEEFEHHRFCVRDLAILVSTPLDRREDPLDRRRIRSTDERIRSTHERDGWLGSDDE